MSIELPSPVRAAFDAESEDAVVVNIGPSHPATHGTLQVIAALDGEKVQRWTEFHEAAARLPDELRAVFDLLWYQEMSQAEAAALLGVAVPTVKLRWMKARLQVQQALGGSPFDTRGPPGLADRGAE